MQVTARIALKGKPVFPPVGLGDWHVPPVIGDVVAVDRRMVPLSEQSEMDPDEIIHALVTYREFARGNAGWVCFLTLREQ